MNSSGRRVENAQKAAVPLNNYVFDFDLGLNLSSDQSSKSLKDQKYNHTPTSSSSSSKSQYPAPAWTPNKPSWTPQPAPSQASKPAQTGFGWTGQSGLSSSGWSGHGQSQPTPMAGDILGKSWAKPDSKKQATSGIVGGLSSGAAPHLFGDLVGEVLGKQKTNAPLKQASSNSSLSMGSVAAALPKGGIPLKDQRAVGRSAEEFGDFADQHTSKKAGDPFDALPTFSNVSTTSVKEDPFGSFLSSGAKEVKHQSTSTVREDPFITSNNEEVFGDFQNVSATKSTANNRHGDPFPSVSVNNKDEFGDFQKGNKNHDSTVSGDPFAASLNVSNDLFGAGSVPNLSNAGAPFTDFSFAATAAASFTDSHTPFATSMKKDTSPVRVADPFEMLNKSFSSQKQVPQEKSKDPLESLLSSSSAAASGGFASQPFKECDDWGLETDFGGGDSGTTTELEGLPPPPAGVTVSIAKDKGTESYKQGQYADAIKWFSWAMVLLEKCVNDSNSSVEVLTCRASCYKEVGEYKKAIDDCSKVLDYDKSNAPVLLQRALLYESTEKYKLGVNDLRNVLKMDPGNRLAKSTLSRLIKMAD